MKKLTFISCLLLSGCLAGAMAANKKQPIYKDAKAPIEERVNDLVSRMTLEEKVQQLNQYTLGRNNNENNRGEEVKKIPATLGSLIYFDEDANLRNEAQRKAMEELMELLASLKPEIDFETEKELIDDGLLESFDVITLIAELEDQFEVEIPAEEIVPENFNSAEGIWNLLQRIKGED